MADIDTLDLGIDTIDPIEPTNTEGNNNVNNGIIANGATANAGEGNEGSNNEEELQATSSTGGAEENQLAEGATVVIDGVNCTINTNGDAVDVNGAIINTSAELAELIAANSDTEPSIIESLQSRFGNEFVDEAGNAVVFEDSVEGINSYIDTVITAHMEAERKATINSLFSEYPALEQAYSHLKVNGTLDGFNEIPDRSNISISKDSEDQQIAVIKEEWNLQGKKGNVQGYIDYLKAAGTLYDTAVESNKTVAEIYDDRRNEIRAEAEKIEAAEQERIESYWESVDETIAKGEILGYKLPDTIKRTFNGKTIASTKEDFVRYLKSPIDAEGNTAYMLDENNLDDNVRMQDDLLKAYLRFTGGDYSSLVAMAVNKEKVLSLKTNVKQANSSRTLVLNSKGNTSKTVSNDQLILG